MRSSKRVGLVTFVALFSGCLLFGPPSAAPAEESKPLRVLRISPSGEDVPPGREIVFQFDRAVVPVGRMARDAAEIPIQITPDPGCEWRWLNTSALACQLGEENALVAATNYRIVVRPGIRTEAGETIAETMNHSFMTRRPGVRHHRFREWRGPGTPAVQITFNQPVDPDSIAEHVRFTVNSEPTGPIRVEAPQRPGIGSSWIVSPESELPLDTGVELAVEPGVVSILGVETGIEDRELVRFRTFPKPRFLGVSCSNLNDNSLWIGVAESGNSEKRCDPQSRISLVFSSPVLLEEVRDDLTVEPDLAGGREDFDPWESFHSYSRLSYSNTTHRYDNRLPRVIKAWEEYHLSAQAEEIEDEFGRSLVADIDFHFYTDHRSPRLHLEHTASVLESGVDSHLPVVLTNLDTIRVSGTEIGADGFEGRWRRNIPVPKVEDVAFRHPLKVRDWLGGDSGAVTGRIHAQPELDQGYEWFISIVTPWQVLVKAGYHNTLVWVTDLTTGEPVAGADVQVRRRVYETFTSDGEVLEQATTDENGLATLAGLETLDPDRIYTWRWRDWDEEHLFVEVEKAGEIAVAPLADSFRVDAQGVNESWLPVSEQERYGHLTTWGFTAQGIYRAGDEVDYKIYVRDEGNRTLIAAPTGPYMLEVYDPMDKVVHKREKVELNEFGALDGRFRVPQSGAVGWYRFELTADFAEAHTWTPLTVLVSDFTPAPFRTTSDLDAELYEDGDEVTVSSSARLHAGGPYVEAETRVTAILRPAPFQASDPLAKGFRFDTGEASEETLHSSEGALDDRGELQTRFGIHEPEALYGTLTVESAVRDDRGKYVAGRSSARYAGRDRYVGIRQGDWVLQVGDPAQVETLVTDAHGALVMDHETRVTVEWRKTHASRVKGAGNAYLTQYTHTWETESTCEIRSLPEPAMCEFSPEHPGLYRLTAVIADTQGRSISSRVERWSVGKGVVLWEEPPGHHLEILPEKETMRVGETARYLIKNPYPGARALVTIERFGVLESWIETLEESSEILEVPIEPDYLPGFYLSVVVVSPRVAPPPVEDQVDLGKPGYRIGYVRVPVRDPYKELQVDVNPSGDLFKPREIVSVEVQGMTRQREHPEIEYAVAVLDEAVLDLLAGGEKLFDPYAGLYELQPLDVINYSLLQRLVGWQKFEKKGADPGGGGGGDASMRSLFKFVSYWNPSLVADAEGRARFEFEVPDNLTAWRVFVVAVTPEDYLGLGQASFKVNRPTEIRPALPNQVIEGDRFDARFTVMNRTDKTRKLKVSIVAEGAGDGERKLQEKVKAEPFKRYIVGLPVAAGAGPGEVRFQVEAGDRKDRDGLISSVPIKRRRAEEVAATYGSTTELEATESILFPAGMRPDVGRVSLVASPTVIGGLEGAFTYLRDYPYICWEQVLTKGVMAAHYTALRAYLSEDLEWPGAADLPLNTLERAADYQTPSGAMSYWVPSDTYASPYLSAYTALAFSWLRDLGYDIPAGVEESLHDYLLRLLRQDVFPGFYSKGMSSSVRAVALAALAREHKVNMDDLDRYRTHLPEMDLFGKAHFLLAQESLGDRAAARAEVRDLILSHGHESGGKFVLSESLDDGYARMLHSGLRTNCAVLTSLLGQGEEERAETGTGDLPFKIVRGIIQSRKQRHHWENTQENMFCTRAMIEYSEAFEQVPPAYTVRVGLDDEAMGEAELDDFRAPPVEFERPVRETDPGRSAKLKIEREGDGRLYYALRLFFSSMSVDPKPVNSGIEVSREYSVERDGAWVLLASPFAVKQGELLRVDLYVSVPTARNFVVVDDPVPGGLEPVNRDLATASLVDADKAEMEFPPDSIYHQYDDWHYYGWTRWSFYHQELRHDSARFYSDYLPAGRYHLSYVAQVIVPGSFAAPSVHAEEMYDPDIFGRGKPGELRVEASQ